MENEKNQLEQDRQTKLDKIRALGIDPYGGNLQTEEDWWDSQGMTWACQETICTLEGGKYDSKIAPKSELTAEHGPVAAGYGRIVLRREMGNLHFLTIRDDIGDIQIAISKKLVCEKEWALAKLLDLGDLISFEGRCAPTKVGEPTVWVRRLSISAKSLAPPPAKHEGLVDVERRYRKRYTDLWSNPEVMKMAKVRAEIVASIRTLLWGFDFLEVETPILQTIAGGAVAQPFKTHHKALDIPMYMRIAPELFLKRLLVGGMPRIFEIGRNFRNEGISPRHNPEFTALELYQSYADHENMMEIVEEIVYSCVNHSADDSSIKDGITFKHKRGWRRATMTEMVQDWCGNYAKNNAGSHLEPSTHTPEALYAFFSEHVEKTIIEPTFVTHLPASVVPLAKNDGKGFALAFELICNGQEIGCGYTEQNDPAVQEKAFEDQIGAGLDEHTKGNVEVPIGTIDDNFLDALRVGMPPAGGLGIGIDRLVMMLTGAESVRDVILFPTMRPL